VSPGKRNTWPLRLCVDRHRDVADGAIELDKAWLEEIGEPAVIAVRGENTSGPALRLRVIHRQRLAAVLSKADYRHLQLPPSKAEIRVRPLTRRESIGRQARNAALPAVGLAGVCAGTAGVIIGTPVLAAIGAGAAIPAAVVGLVKSRKG
jgi:hypothetical protein